MRPNEALCLRDLLASQAARNPEAIALVAPGRDPVSYSQLLAQVDHMLHELKESGVGRRDQVALVMPNGPEMVAAFLGTASVAACAPLNPSFQSKEFRFFLSDLGAKILVVSAGEVSPVREVARELGIVILELDYGIGAEPWGFRLSGRVRHERQPEGSAAPDDVALVLHTSGTTSRPKIVPLTQADLCVSARNTRDCLQLDATDICLNLAPLFYAYGLVAGMMTSLSAGSCVICPADFVATRFFQWMDEFKPTWYSAVPTVHQAILARAQDNREIIERCPLRFIRSSGAPLPPMVMAELEETFKTPVLDSYGITEGSVHISCNPRPPRTRKPSSVGLPAGCRVAVMDQEGNFVRPGETGEIVVRPANINIVYENDPEANRSAFIQGWFRTGDQGYVDDEGYIYLTGRIKEIINRGGEKISPPEVDEVFMGHPSVAEVVTFAVPHPQLGEEVAAAVVLRPGFQTGEEELRRFAAEHLAYFKVPRRVLVLDELPKGPTGKLQRIGLAEKLGLGFEDLLPAASAGKVVTPSTELEEMLAGIWAQAMGLERIGVEDNFFLSGGDSMRAAELLARIEEVLKIRLPVAFLVIAPTVRKMAEAIANGKLPAEWPALVPVRPSGSRPPIFFVHTHDGQVFLYHYLARFLGPEQPVYGFQAFGLQEERKLPGSLEDLAASYVAELVGFQPEGPYYLGGRCMGGVVAFEMARQLEAMGRRVALLALLDVYAPGHPKPLARSTALTGLMERATYYLQRLRPFLQYLLSLKPEHRVDYLANLVPSVPKQVLHVSLQVSGRSLPDFLRPGHGTLQDLMTAYRPQVYRGSAVVFRPNLESISYQRDPQMGWGDLVLGGLEVVELPGYHRTSLFRSWNEILAVNLRKIIHKAQMAERK